MSMPTIDPDREDVQEALLAVYLAIEEHQDFWRPWIAERMGIIMARGKFNRSIFASEVDEQQAAETLGAALAELASLADATEKL